MKQEKKQSDGKTVGRDKNAGSATFNQGSEQDPDYDKGTKVSDEEKKKGNKPALRQKKENPQVGNIGKNNAGGYE